MIAQHLTFLVAAARAAAGESPRSFETVRQSQIVANEMFRKLICRPFGGIMLSELNICKIATSRYQKRVTDRRALPYACGICGAHFS